MQIKFPTEETVDSRTWRERMYAYRFVVFGMVGALLFGALFAYKMTSAKGRFLKDYLNAHQMIGKLSKGESVDPVTIQPLLDTRPELAPLFHHYLEEGFALSGKTEEAVAIGEKTLDRLKFFEGPYLDYARASLLIEKKDYEPALLASYELNLALESKMAEYPRLYLFNLVRMAILEKNLDKESAEKSFAKAKKALTDENCPIENSVQKELLSHFSDDRASMLD